MPNIYGPVNGARKKVEQIYGSVNGARKEVLRAYGSVNGTTKVVFEKEAEYGLLEYYPDYSRNFTPSSGTSSFIKYEIDDFDGLVDYLTAKVSGDFSASLQSSSGKGIYVQLHSETGAPIGEISDNAVLDFEGQKASSTTGKDVEVYYSEIKPYAKIEYTSTPDGSNVSFFVFWDQTYNVTTASGAKLHELTQAEFQSYYSKVGFYVNDKYIPNIAVKGYSFGKSVQSIPTAFLSGAKNLVRLSPIPSGVTTIGANFLQGCTSFNQQITIPSSVTTIGAQFLQGCTSFNQPIIISLGVATIAGNFLSGCTSFNQPLTIPLSATTIDAHFLQGCTSFNQPITIPSGVTTIGTSFLYGCTSFNQPITIPSGVTRLNQHFLSGCTSFNQPLTIPSTITSVYREVLENLDSFVGPLTIETSATSSSSASGRQKTLATTNPSALCYTQGITITGSQASVWKNAYADENGTTAVPLYRKLILGS